MRANEVLLCVLLVPALLLSSCASSQPQVAVRAPACIASTRAVGLAPIRVDGLTRSYCKDAEQLAMETLLRRVEQSTAFTVVHADVLLAEMSHPADGSMGEPVVRLRLPDGDVVDLTKTGAVMAAARRLGLDGVLFCRISSHQTTTTTTGLTDIGFSYSSEGGLNIHSVGMNDVSRTEWSGVAVSLQIVQTATGGLIVESLYDTSAPKAHWHWGARVEDGIVDVIERAFKPIAEIWAR